MAKSCLTLHLDASLPLWRALDDIAWAAQTAGASFPEFFEHVAGFLEGSGGIRCTAAFDGDGPAAARAGDFRACLEPTEALLELAAAARAGNFNFRIKHGVAP